MGDNDSTKVNKAMVYIKDIGGEWSVIQMSNEKVLGFFKTKAQVINFCDENHYYINRMNSSASWTYGRG